MSTFKKDLEEINVFLSDYQFPNKELTKELNALVQGTDDVVLLLYSRRALEVIITEICVEILERDRGSEPLKGIIDRLYKEKIIPAYIHTSMSNLNSMSTYGAHPKEFNQRQVKSTIIELTTVLEWYIHELKKLEKTDAQNEVKSEPEPVKIETKAEKIQTKSEEPETKKSEPKPENESGSKKKGTGIIIITAVVIIIAVVYFAFFKPGNKIEQVPVKDTAIEETTPSGKTETPVANEPSTNITAEKKETNPVKPAIKPTEVTVKLPDNIEDAFNKFKDLVSIDQKKQAAAILLKRFTSDALIYSSSSGDTRSADEFINQRLFVTSYTYKVDNIEKDGNLIKKMIIEEIK